MDYTIISAMNDILKSMKSHGMSEVTLYQQKGAFDYLERLLGLTYKQMMLITVMVENGEEMNWGDFARFFSCNRLTVMSLAPDMMELIQKRWVSRSSRGLDNVVFALMPGVVSAISRNTRYVPESLEGMCTRTLLDKFHSYMRPHRRHRFDTEDVVNWLLRACNANPQLPLCQKALQYSSNREAVMLLFLQACDYMKSSAGNDGMTLDAIENMYSDDVSYMLESLEDGKHILQNDGLLEFKCEDGVCDNQNIVLTRKAREELLSDITPRRRPMAQGGNHSGLIKASSIVEKQMFYNAAEQKQLDRLAKLLSAEQLPLVQQRLKQRGLRQGFACLFHGGPGTGKTETVLQLARRTGRDVMQVDIAGMRDKYVGESEKNIKAVFKNYREACCRSKQMPILLFNEADALINKRSQSTEHSVDKMENAMQNIILQEIEKLDGILIATTNLITNLDEAFDRRFIFKIQFDQPNVEVKTKLWRSMFGDEISEQEASLLASRYNLSGGQIENVVRKHTIDYIINGASPSFNELGEYCQQEFLRQQDKPRNNIGF